MENLILYTVVTYSTICTLPKFYRKNHTNYFESDNQKYVNINITSLFIFQENFNDIELDTCDVSLRMPSISWQVASGNAIALSSSISLPGRCYPFAHIYISNYIYTGMLIHIYIYIGKEHICLYMHIVEYVYI